MSDGSKDDKFIFILHSHIAADWSLSSFLLLASLFSGNLGLRRSIYSVAGAVLEQFYPLNDPSLLVPMVTSAGSGGSLT